MVKVLRNSQMAISIKVNMLEESQTGMVNTIGRMEVTTKDYSKMD
jgi:hypothetical protein